MNKQTSIEAEEGTPNENQVLHDRQNHLEEQLQVSILNPTLRLLLQPAGQES